RRASRLCESKERKMYVKKSITVGQQELSIETGKMAKQADGAVVVRYGDTILLVTAVSLREKKDVDFLPLTVEYQEKLYSAGRIHGSYFKREGRLTEKETLTSRLIDRACRPLFPEGYGYETQIISGVISADQDNEGDVHGITGASAALWCSDIPFNGPIAGIRVGRINGELIAYPSAKQREESDLDLVMACSREAIVMVEGGAKEISESDMVLALEFGKQAVQPVLELEEQMRRELGAAPRAYEKLPAADEALKAKVRELAWSGIVQGYEIKEKHARYEALSNNRKEVQAKLRLEFGEGYTPAVEKAVKAIYEDLKYEYMRALTVSGGRIGARSHDAVRQITCEVGLLPRVHGSALFTRGETQALVVVTLGTSEDEQRLELLSGQSFKKFMLHYNFPPFSVN